MRRRIVTLAALTLGLSAIGIAPVTAQAASGITGGGHMAISADLISSVDVGSMSPVALGNLNPETGGSQNFNFTVAYNGSGYTVAFSSLNQATTGGTLQMANSVTTTDYLPYTIVGLNTNDAATTYTSGTTGPALSATTANFTLGVAGLTTLSTALPSGAYTDTLTVLVTAV